MNPTLRLRGATVDLDRGQAVRGAKVEQLTAKELALLRYLVDRAGEVVPRDELLTEVWGYRPGLQSRTVDTTLRRLRIKVEEDPDAPHHLLTRWGEGYTFVGVEEPKPDAPVGPSVGGLIGRDGDLAALKRHIADGAKWITLLGPGGVGKTTLARSAAPGARWVALDGAQDTEAFLTAVARAVGVQIKGITDLAESIGLSLSARPGETLILDELEGVASQVGGLIEGWLARVPGLVVVATSRVEVGAPGERRFRLGALRVDDAAELYLLRAAGQGHLDRSSPGIVELVEELDRLPLAIELAAARAGLIGPEALVRRLRAGKGLPGRSGADRHASMERALQWSWELLGDDARRALAALALAPAGFDADLAEAILDDPDPWAILEELVAASLITAGPAGRLGMMTAVRDFAARRCAQAPAVRGRLAQALHDRFIATVHPLWGPWTAKDARALSQERASLESLADGWPTARHLLMLLSVHDGDEHRAALCGEEARCDELAADRAWAMALLAATHRKTLAPAAAIALAEAALTLAPDDDARAMITAELVRSKARVGDLDGALAESDRALAWAQGLTARTMAATSAAQIRIRFGRDAEAFGLAQQALGAARQGVPVALAHSAGLLFGTVAFRMDHYSDADHVFGEVVATATESGDRAAATVATIGQALVAVGLRQADRARDLAADGVRNARILGQRHRLATALANQGWVLRELAQDADAVAPLAEARLLFSAGGDRWAGGKTLLIEGAIRLLEGRLDLSDHLLAQVLDGPPAPDPNTRAKALSWLSMVRVLQGRPEDGLAAATEALDCVAGPDDPERAQLFARRAAVFGLLGRKGEAEADLAEGQRLLGAGPDGPRVAFELWAALARGADPGTAAATATRPGEAPGMASWEASSSEVRLALRVLRLCVPSLSQSGTIEVDRRS